MLIFYYFCYTQTIYLSVQFVFSYFLLYFIHIFLFHLLTFSSLFFIINLTIKYKNIFSSFNTLFFLGGIYYVIRKPSGLYDY